MKLKLQPDPTFKAKVGIPVPGAGFANVEFTFKHRTMQQLQAFIEASIERDSPETVMEMATGWDLVDAFTIENVRELDNNYIGAGRAIFDAYVEELTKARLKNLPRPL